MKGNKNLYRLIPKVDDLLENEDINKLLDLMPRKLVVDSIREEIDLIREDIKNKVLDEDNIKERIKLLPKLIKTRANRKNSYRLKRVINGTGVVIHTNIGRSLIHKDVMDNVVEIATNYSNLEYDLEKGTRGSRYSHLEDILIEITGGEAAMVVNNNAAAVLLVLSTLAKNKEVIVSRGELIEIGGSFRIPDVMEQSGAILVSVGTTNKTHLWDYENAINEETAALLKVHTSNYRILGFTSSVSAEELYKLKQKYNIPLIEDLGSGVLIDLSKYGLEHEPTVQDSIKSGVDVVTFSGDKLLGGPQAGIIIGKKKYIEAMKKNPLTRAFRVDKFTISALEATLRLYLDEENVIEKIPTLNMLTMGMDELENKANMLYNLLKAKIKHDDLIIDIVNSYSEVGGGSLPLERIPTKCISLKFKNSNITKFEKYLRELQVPIITRVYKDTIFIDLRTVKEEEFFIVVDGIYDALKELGGVG
ncbi:L-seryl-tRNA(Sec) selenium transferase [Caproiciproducens sp. MSJ-32]|uniref:L-seryl-tRNA(Sec) selenium transferase n=1 Tax=Caproiciproducens sp. MSJ-32 TaxID=2841527 RepID=UPI001C1154A4|nr:L-seryl-tRNA(Sec) selenium transferase [Caproiciproducens sp. MSJ-32]MBU5455473.1 L-seryl-tRNA(Sec) selenium transferase [Caproiciproducens sp. MSJ-32]